MGDLSIGKAIWGIKFPASALLFDNRGKIASEWQHKGELSEWRITHNDVLIHNSSQTRVLHASHQEISVEAEMPNSYDEFQKIAADFSIKTLNTLQVRKINRIGLRLIMFNEREHFRTWVNKMRTSLYRLTEADWNVIGGYPEDVGTIALNLKLGENKASFSIGPMEKSQLAEQFRSAEAKAKLPAVLIFVDFDLFRSDPKWNSNSYAKQLSDFLAKGGDEIQRLANAFVDNFGGFK